MAVAYALRAQHCCTYQLLNKHFLRRSASQLPINESNNSEDEHTSPTLKRIKQELAADKQKLKWRVPIGDRSNDWNSKFKLFSNMEQNSDYIILMQRPINLSPKSIKEWWNKRVETTERYKQQFIPERNHILGPDLAAAHFILYRGGAAKFVDDQRWHHVNEDGEIYLPNKYHPNYKVEALRCDNMLLYYEGLENIRDLEQLKFLSFHNVKVFDDWSLDRISGGQYPRLEVLDISGTSISVLGLSCLYRLNSLKLLILDNPKSSLEFELACAMLEVACPLMKIVGADTIHKLDD